MRVLVVGATPPPLYGQAIMLQHLLDTHMHGIEFVQVRTEFSKDMRNIGKASLRKAFHLLKVIAEIAYKRATTRADILYYAPGGSTMAPIIRDIAILILVRPLFRKTVFHFHAAGLLERYPKLGHKGQMLFKKAYWNPDLSIRVSSFTPEDAKFVQSKDEVVVPNGLIGADEVKLDRRIGETLKLLYVGLLSEDKGILIALRALPDLKRTQVERKVIFTFVGDFLDPKIRTTFSEVAKKLGVEENIRLTGSLQGAEKWHEYDEADIFVFPSFFASESFGMVLVEAMSAGLPVVATNWRGIPEVVQSGTNGLLVPPQDPSALAKAISILANSAELRSMFAVQGRKAYEERFTLAKWQTAMHEAFMSLELEPVCETPTESIATG